MPEPWAVCKHMAAVAGIRAETDRMAALIPVCRDQLTQGIGGSPEQHELNHLHALAANRDDWEEDERAAIAQLLTYQDQIDPETWQRRHPALDAATHALLDQLLGSLPIDLTDEEIAILSAQQEE